jgi:5-oxoprolinase (ATP-hydrolysing)
VDIGGTFTDIALLDDNSGQFWPCKRLTTPDDPSDAVIEGVREVLDTADVDPHEVEQFFHATTLATNALTERQGSPTALITTAGFRDVLEMRDEGRYDLFDLDLELPPPLVERDLCLEVRERVAADGSVLEPLDEASLRPVIEKIAKSAVNTIAVSLLHSYRNDEHEHRISTLLQECLPGRYVSISSEVAPEIREYQRTSTTVANAYVQPVIDRYLTRLQERIRAMGIDSEILIMLSSGGACTLEVAKRFPVRLVESGPAAGAILAAASGRLVGQPSLSSFDMGGTTAKSCLVVDGAPRMAQEFETARVWRFRKGSGLPLRTPVIELIEIGAGGGSIASVNKLGVLDVGPHSAGADPGPACYGLGGTRPTVTDADLLLGYLDSHHFLGGSMVLDRGAAEDAIYREVAEPLGIDVMQAAWAVHAKVNEAMAAAARMAAVERGGDPSEYPLFAFGGAGPVHAYGVGTTLRVPQVVIGVGAGIGSALGLLAAPVAFDLVRSHPSELQSTDWGPVTEVCRSMVQEGTDLLSRAGVSEQDIGIQISADLRYQGQGYEIEVGCPDSVPDGSNAREILERFVREYEKRYGHALTDVPIEIINWRCRASGPAAELGSMRPNRVESRGAEAPATYTRPAYFDGVGLVGQTPVYSRQTLEAGAVLTGPCIVEEPESTTVVGPDGLVIVHDSGSLLIQLPEVSRMTGSDDRAEALDPLLFDIFWTRLTALLNEQATAIQRAAFSPLVREAGDCSVGVFALDGRMVAQAVTGTPGHVFALPACVKYILRERPPEEWQDGDVVITNDPYQNCGHQYDITIASPILRHGQMIGLYASTAHVLDIGGRPMSALANDVYEEGLIIPPSLFRHDGRVDPLLERLIRANVRTPNEVIGDINALVGVNEVGRRRFIEYMDELKIGSLAPAAAEMMARSEHALRNAISRLPDGEYVGEVHADGFKDEDVLIRATLSITGDTINVDFTGTSGPSRYGINVIYNYTHAYAVYALKCALAPEVPNNEGSLAPITVTAPPGCLLNAQPPSPIAMRHVIGHLIPGAIYVALAKAAPEATVIAEGAGAVWHTTIKGHRDDRRFLSTFLTAGGMGARPTKDGLNCVAFPTGTRSIPIEILESTAPLIFDRKEFIEDSGGDGQFRGGSGQRIVVGLHDGWSGQVTVASEHTVHAPQGLAGGGAGSRGRVIYGGEEVPPKETYDLGDGARITIELPGGGGYGNPALRSDSARDSDRRSGLVNVESHSP